MPSTQSAPRTAPVIEVIPPSTAITTKLNERLGENVSPGAAEKLRRSPP